MLAIIILFVVIVVLWLIFVLTESMREKEECRMAEVGDIYVVHKSIVTESTHITTEDRVLVVKIEGETAWVVNKKGYYYSYNVIALTAPYNKFIGKDDGTFLMNINRIWDE